MFSKKVPKNDLQVTPSKTRRLSTHKNVPILNTWRSLVTKTISNAVLYCCCIIFLLSSCKLKQDTYSIIESE